MAKHLSVSLHRSISLGSPCATEEGKPSKYLDVSLQYCPKIDAAGTSNSEEINDRDWFKTLVEFNPSIDNLSEVVNASARKMIEQVKPAEVYMCVRLSNDVDSNGFCTKEVHFNWSEETEV